MQPYCRQKNFTVRVSLIKTNEHEIFLSSLVFVFYSGASRFFGVEEEPIFNILAVASRAQCVAISQAYESAFGMTLTKAIKKKFSGNISKLLILWIQPLPHSVATLLRNAVSKVFPNKLAIAKIVAKYEKNFLSQVDHACAQLFNMSLIKLLGKALSGTFSVI